MPRLFWKFFATIWLTLATTLTVIIVIVNLFQIPPPGRDREYQERAIILKLTANVLARDGEDAAERFIRSSEDTVPLGLTLSKTMESLPAPRRSGSKFRPSEWTSSLPCPRLRTQATPWFSKASDLVAPYIHLCG